MDDSEFAGQIIDSKMFGKPEALKGVPKESRPMTTGTEVNC